MSWLPPPASASALPPPRQAVIDARHELSAAVAGRFSTGTLDRLSYARDMWPLTMVWIRQGKVPPPPDAVVWPASEAELLSLIRIARERHLALIPFGGGSGVCGGTWAIEGGVCVDLKRFERIGELDQLAQSVEVGAGIFGETLERELNARGWTLGHFPSSLAMSTVGGWLAARSAGQLSSKYGKIEDMLIAARLVTGAGEVLDLPARPLAGPEVLPLVLGSEGAFGFFTRATLRVFPIAENRVFQCFEFPSVENGLEAIRLLFREGLRPAVVRLYDPFDTAFVSNAGPAPRKPVVPPSKRSAVAREWLPKVMRVITSQTLGRPALLNQLQRVFRRSRLILMFEGETGRTRAEALTAAQCCRALGARELGEAPARAWFSKRYDVAFRLSRLIDSGAFADTMEIAATWEHVHEVYRQVHEVASQHAFVLCHFSHAYAEGCSLYFSFVGSGASEEEMEERYRLLWKVALSAAVSAGGNVSHHHGVGLLKARVYQETLGEGRETLASLKALFDPDHVLNPGKLGLGRVARPVASAAVRASSSRPLCFTPATVREVKDALHVLADAGARVGLDGTTLDRSRLDSVGPAHAASMTVEAGAGVRLRALEATLRPQGLSLGPLSPGALALSLARFVEGPHAGLRAIPGGRLEPLALRVEGLTADGRHLRTPLAPRSAAGPDLAALFHGAGGRLALLTSARLRCVPRPEAEATLAFQFPSVEACLPVLRRLLSEGLVLSSVQLAWSGEHLGALLRWSGSVASVQRDRELILRLAGTPRGPEGLTARAGLERETLAPDGPQGLTALTGLEGEFAPRSAEDPAARPTLEREASWASVRTALEARRPLTLYRLSLGSVIATGELEGLPLEGDLPWPEPSKKLLALDPLGTLGGAP